MKKKYKRVGWIVKYKPLHGKRWHAHALTFDTTRALAKINYNHSTFQSLESPMPEYARCVPVYIEEAP